MPRFSFLFIVSWVMWLAGHVFQQSAIYMDSSDVFLKTLYILSFALLVFYEVVSAVEYKKADVFAFAVLALLAMPFFQGVASIFIQGLLFVVIGRRVSFDCVARATLVTLAATTTIIVFLSWAGVIPTEVYVEAGGRVRSTLGFTYPSRYPNFVFTMILLVLYVCKGKTTVVLGLMMGVLAYAAYVSTGSRSPFMLSLFALVAFFLVALRRPIFSSRGWMMALAPVFILCAAVIAYLSYSYDPTVSWLKGVNDLVSNRLLYSHNAFCSQPPTLFGTDLFSQQEVSYSVGYLDSSYLQLLLSYGVIPFVCVMTLLTRLMYLSLRANNRRLVVCLVCIAVHSVLEWQLTWIIYTPFLFLLFAGYEEIEADESCEQADSD